jgi:hypothetical protein
VTLGPLLCFAEAAVVPLACRRWRGEQPVVQGPCRWSVGFVAATAVPAKVRRRESQALGTPRCSAAVPPGLQTSPPTAKAATRQRGQQFKQ